MDWKQWEGRVIDGRFHLQQYLGGSAHSAVFVTEYGSESPRKVAIKLVPADSGAAHVWMLRRELAARLSQPGLLSIFEFGTCQLDGADLAYVVMEQSEEDLSQVIPVRPLDSAEVREMLPPVLETLAYLHAEGFVHGCLTPANIMAADDRVKLSSDGLLRIGESSDDLLARNVNGPPEGRTGMTPAGDVWSLGMTLVEVLTQQAPAWDGAANDPVVPERLEAPFLDIVHRCLRSDPRSRCSLDDIARALQPLSPAPKARPSAADSVPIAKQLTPAVAQRWRYILWVAGAAILGVLFFTGGVLTRARLNPTAASESRPAAPSRQVASSEKPRPVSDASPAVKVAAVTADKEERSAPPTAAPAAETQPAVPVPATDHSATTVPGAEVVDRVVPEVPAQILGTIQGRVTVKVRVRVDRFGAVTDVDLDSPARSKYFDRVALDAARRWKFKPAHSAGSDVESTRLVRFEFWAKGCETTSDQVQP